MNLLPRLDEIIPTGESHRRCSYKIQALLNDIRYINYIETQCVSMPLVNVCPKCGKYITVGRIPVSVNNFTIQKYGIDIDRNIRIQTKQIVELDFVATSFNRLTNATGTIQTLDVINFVSENQFRTLNAVKRFLNVEVMNEIVQNWKDYSNLDYKFVGYDYNGNLKYCYEETANNGGIEVQIIYTKTIIN
jgi:hypothetical protein